MEFFNYLKYSNVKLSIDLNPFVWGFIWHYEGPNKEEPKFHAFYWRILPFSLRIIIDG